MVTLKTSLLSVTRPLPVVNSVRRNATLETDQHGIQFMVYDGEREEVKLLPEFISDLLDLVKPWDEIFPDVEESEDDSKDTGAIDIDPLQVQNFLNRWGMIGLADDKRLLVLPPDPDRLALLFTPRPPIEKRSEAVRIFSYKGNIRPEYQERVRAVWVGDQVPYLWIVNELINLAMCVRLVKNLLLGDSRGKEKFALTIPNRKRILSAWGRAPFAIPDTKDPAKYRSLDKSWLGVWDDGLNGCSLDDADLALDEFAHLMNKYLLPLSSRIVRSTEVELSYHNDVCFETALASYILDQLRNGGAARQCQQCARLYFPLRTMKDGKWCSPRCGSIVRNREKRRRDKVGNQVHSDVRLLKAQLKERGRNDTSKSR